MMRQERGGERERKSFSWEQTFIIEARQSNARSRLVEKACCAGL